MIQAIDYAAIAAPLLVALAALAVLVLDLLLPSRRGALGWLSLAACLGALALVVPLVGQRRSTFCVDAAGAGACSYAVDEFTVAFQLLVLAGSAVVVLMSVTTVADDGLPGGEYWFLLLCSVSGALVLAAARDLLTLVVALEVVSLPGFALVGLRRADPRSSEAALKFFLVSVVSTAVTLFGASLVYGVTGAVHLEPIAAALAAPGPRLPVTTVGVALTLAGFAFKVAAVPFHFWAPDTYVGAPVPVAAYLSVVSKAAGFAGLLLLLTVGFGPYAASWAPVLATVAALTMTLGNLVALRQRQAVRLLAWSSVAQSGYMLVPLGAAAGGLASAVSATVAYVLAYAVMNLGAFAVVTLVGRQRPANDLDDYRGLLRASPLAAAALGFALACLAGLPPGLLGLFAKVAVFATPVAAGTGWLAVVMAVNIVVALYYYLAWAARALARPEHGVEAYRVPLGDTIAIALTLAAAIAFSAVPGVLLGALASA
ncbi:MAG: NADH-quinone oxidoreductase subunit N [Actinomycetota bacterium]|nr:NADH-quinone oxidoreductase subunit N [Actinomycetota bacterium]